MKTSNMYQILPFIAAAEFQLPNLPAELWSIILRCLDPSSLLTAIRTNEVWKRISQEDPILKKTVKEQLTLEKRRRREVLLNPGLLISTHRDGTDTFFGRNTTKTVRRIPMEKLVAMNQGKRKRRQNGDGGPLRKKPVVRSEPRRSMRC